MIRTMERRTDSKSSVRRSFYVKVHLSAYLNRGPITPNGYSPPPFGKKWLIETHFGSIKFECCDSVFAREKLAYLWIFITKKAEVFFLERSSRFTFYIDSILDI